MKSCHSREWGWRVRCVLFFGGTGRISIDVSDAQVFLGTILAVEKVGETVRLGVPGVSVSARV